MESKRDVYLNEADALTFSWITIEPMDMKWLLILLQTFLVFMYLADTEQALQRRPGL
jgi:hypothetical protein